MHIYILTINQTKLIYYWILTFLKFKYITFVSNYAFVLSHCEFLTTDKNCFEIPGAGCVNDLYVYIQKPCVRLFPRHTHYIIIKEECKYCTYSIIHLTESMCTHVFLLWIFRVLCIWHLETQSYCCVPESALFWWL